MPFVSLRFVFRDSHPNERANNTAECATGSEASKSGYDRTGRNQWTESGNCKSADPDKQSQSSTDHSAGRNSSGGAFWCFCALVVRKVFRTFVVRKQNRDIVV